MHRVVAELAALGEIGLQPPDVSVGDTAFGDIELFKMLAFEQQGNILDFVVAIQLEISEQGQFG